MPTLTIKGVPPELHQKLKERAERHRESGEQRRDQDRAPGDASDDERQGGTERPFDSDVLRRDRGGVVGDCDAVALGGHG